MSDRKDIKKIGVVILAAGGSSRLGQPKQLLLFKDKPLLQNTIEQSQEAFTFTSNVLVLGAYGPAIQESIDPGNFQVVMNEDWVVGMAGSIRKGLECSLEIDPELDHILVLLSDQPFVTSQLIRELIETHMKKGKEITACRYEDTVGAPAIFSRRLFKELSLLEGDHGARVLIRKYPEKLTVVPFELGSVDVDKPEDYSKLLDF
jgi:molybdenum cofactor cytidylyltransferase